MKPHFWITAGWAGMAAAAGLAAAGGIQAVKAVSATCVQPPVTAGLTYFTCPGTGAEFLRGLICAVLAGVAFFSGLACFFWAAHLRLLEQTMRLRQS